MIMKKVFFVLFTVMAVICFCFTPLLSASDAKKTGDKPEVLTDAKQATGTEVKSDVKNDLKPEEKAKKDDAKAVRTININKATALELSSGLKKVGPKYAAAIVKYREENGEFQAPEDIKKVKGIGDKIFEINKDRIVVKD